jgi:hypothetical protein
MATARHQQTNGGAESMVKLVKQVLKGFVDYQKSNWTQFCREAQFAINNSVSSATGFTPHYLAFAFQPSLFPALATTKTALGMEFESHYMDLEQAHRNIYKAQDAMANDYNRSRGKGLFWKSELRSC